MFDLLTPPDKAAMMLDEAETELVGIASAVADWAQLHIRHGIRRG